VELATVMLRKVYPEAQILEKGKFFILFFKFGILGGDTEDRPLSDRPQIYSQLRARRRDTNKTIPVGTDFQFCQGHIRKAMMS
jgi:hypothetical protein